MRTVTRPFGHPSQRPHFKNAELVPYSKLQSQAASNSDAAAISLAFQLLQGTAPRDLQSLFKKTFTTTLEKFEKANPDYQYNLCGRKAQDQIGVPEKKKKVIEKTTPKKKSVPKKKTPELAVA